jgi:NAD(P)-dependent dehydrogenase (short-subunit alcohol dehydrogenase family)
MDELRFDDRVAIVTGAGRGLGRDHALLLARRGAAVVVNDLGGDEHGVGASAAPAQEVVAEIVTGGGRAIANHGSVASEDDAQALVAAAVDAFGRIDIVVNNAGNQIVLPFPTMPVEVLHRHFAVHVAGSFHVTQAAWPHLERSGAGRVVNTTSTASLGITGFLAYSTAKAALIGLTRTLALEGAAAGIKVNAVAPSAATRLAFAPDAAGDIPDEVRQTMARTSPAALVSPVVAYLAHESCAFTGEVLFAGAGRVSRIVLAETRGIVDADLTVESVAAGIERVMDDTEVLTLPDAMRRAQAWAERVRHS